MSRTSGPPFGPGRLLPLFALLPIFLLLAPPAQATFPGQNGRIAFVANNEIYTVNPNGTGVMRLTNNSVYDSSPDWSPDGTRIAFQRFAGEGDDWEIFVMNADGSGVTQVTNNEIVDCADPPQCLYFQPADDTHPSWSPDGRIAFQTNRDGQVHREFGGDSSEVYVMDGTGANQRMISDPTGCKYDHLPEWAPNGETIAYRSSSVYPFCSAAESLEFVSPDPGGPANASCTARVDFEWTPGSQTLLHRVDVYPSDSADLYELNVPCGTDTRLINTPDKEIAPSPSPDNTKVVYAELASDYQTSGDVDLVIMNHDGSGRVKLTDNDVYEVQPDWQSSDTPAPSIPPQDGYARPKSATGTTVKLVPAFNACTAPNAVHGAPLSQPSCNPTTASSPYLTIGTPDSNGYASSSTGYVRITSICNPPAPNPVPPCNDLGEQADVKLDAQLTDVRCLGISGGCATTTGDLTDYQGLLEVRMLLRITDRLNAGVGEARKPATVVDVPFRFTMPCAGDEDTTVGSSCSVSTTANAVTGGIVRESRRTIWEVRSVEVWDGGEGGAPNTGGNALFAVQGLFLP